MRIECDRINTVVVKIGTSLIPSISAAYGGAEKIVDDVADLVHRGIKVIIVSSGAIGAGTDLLNLPERPKSLPKKQAAAAVGQGMLMHFYRGLFDRHDLQVAQILLTQDDLNDRRKYLNARNTLAALLEYENVVPIINENDTVAVEEIKLGDNDTLSAIIASKIDADLLVILTDTEGLYDGDPRKGGKGRFIDEVEIITPEIEAMAGGTGSSMASGGMHTKVLAAKIAGRSGTAVIIADGNKPHVLHEIFAGKQVGTYFHPQKNTIAGRKRWIAFGLAPQGKIKVDKGAEEALLKRGGSLLPSGVVEVQGRFELGDAISILGPANNEIARGLTNYSSDEVDKIKGHRTKEIPKVLGHKDYDEIIHRDNMVLV